MISKINTWHIALLSMINSTPYDVKFISRVSAVA